MGMISTVAGSGTGGSPRDGIDATEARIDAQEVVAGEHGGFAFAGAGVRRVTRSGIIHTVAGARGSFSPARGMGLWNGDGSNAKRARLDDIGGFGLAVTPGDDYLLAGRAAMRLMPSPLTPRLAVAARVVLPARRRLSYVVTRPATLRLELRGLHGRIVLDQRADAGRGRFRFPR